MARTRSEAHENLAKASERRARDGAARHAKLDKRIAEQLRAAEERIAAAKSDALDNIADVAGEIAEAATEKLIGSAPTRARRARR